jgi:hypothetical protein
MIIRSAVLVIALALAAACETGEATQFRWIAGPSVLPVATERPYTWDSREELEAWVNNPVTRGLVTLEEEGTDAFIRLRLVEGRDTVLRGPDLHPPALVRGVRMRVRATSAEISDPAARLPGPPATGIWYAQPVDPPWPPSVLLGSLASQLPAQWSETVFVRQDSAPQNAQYVYFVIRFTGTPWEVDIDWISIVQ